MKVLGSFPHKDSSIIGLFFFPPEKFMARVKEVTEKACEVFFVALLAF